MHRAAVRRRECDWGVLNFPPVETASVAGGCMDHAIHPLNTSQGALQIIPLGHPPRGKLHVPPGNV